jgi:hypothetical protein
MMLWTHGVRCILSFACLAWAQPGLVWRAEGKNITSISFATNTLGATISYTDAIAAHFLALTPSPLRVDPLWVYTPPPHPNGTDSLHVYGARRVYPGTSFNLTNTSVDHVVAAVYSGQYASVELFGITSTAPTHDTEWHYVVQGIHTAP